MMFSIQHLSYPDRPIQGWHSLTYCAHTYWSVFSFLPYPTSNFWKNVASNMKMPFCTACLQDDNSKTTTFHMLGCHLESVVALVDTNWGASICIVNIGRWRPLNKERYVF